MPSLFIRIFRRHRHKLCCGAFIAFVVALLLWSIVHLMIFPARVYGTSMMPTLKDGDWLLATRIPLWFGGGPQRLDIVLCRYPDNGNTTYVKRVVGLPGETIAIQDGVLSVDGVPLQEPYLQQMPNYRMSPYVLGADQFFVLGDNRPRSEDSHNVGAIHRSMIEGVIAWRCYPLEKIGPLPSPIPSFQ